MNYIRLFILCLFALIVVAIKAQNPVISLSSGLQVRVGDTFDVHLMVDADLSPSNVLAYSFAINYNANLMNVKSVQYDDKLAYFSNVANLQTTGKVLLSGASSSKVSGSGLLLTLTFEAKASGNSSLTFVTAESLLNEGLPAISFQNGSVSIANKPIVTVTPNTSFMPIGQTVQCYVSGSVTHPVTWGVTNPLVGNVSESGLFTAVGHGTTRIFVQDAAGLRDTTDGVFDITGASLYFPSGMQQWQGWEVEIPVKTTNVSSLNVFSGQFTLKYRTDVLQFAGVVKDGTLLQQGSVAAGETAAGTLQVAFATANSLGDATDDLMKLRFNVLPVATAVSHLNFSDVVYNEDIRVFTQNSNFTPRLLPVLSVAPTSAALVAGDSIQFTVANGIEPYEWSVSDERVGVVRPNGWFVANEGGRVDVQVVDAVGAMKSVQNVAVADMRMYFPADSLVRVSSEVEVSCFVDSIPIGRMAVSSIEGEISVSNANVRILDIVTDGTFTEGWQKIITKISDQRIRFYLAGSSAFRDKGVAFLLKTELLSGFKEYARSDVRFHNVIVNEETPAPLFVNGIVEGKIFTDQDKTICLGDNIGVITVPDASGKTISSWKMRVRRPVATSWVNVSNSTSSFQHTPDKTGEWEYVAVVDGVDTKIANIKVNTIPDVVGVIRGETVFCNTPQVLRYVVQRRPTATEFHWNYTGAGVVLHPKGNVLDLEVTSEVTPGVLEMYTANYCGRSQETLQLSLLPTIQPASFSYQNDVVYYNRDTIKFVDSSVGAMQWEWSVSPADHVVFVAGTSAASQHPQLQFLSSGDFEVKLKALNSCRVDSFVQTVVVQEFKRGELQLSSQEVCFGSGIDVELMESSGRVLVWQVKPVAAADWVEYSVSDGEKFTFIAGEPNEYHIRAKLAYDRAYSDTAIVKVNAIPQKPTVLVGCDKFTVATEHQVEWFRVDNLEVAVFEGNDFTPEMELEYVARVTANDCQSPFSDLVVLMQPSGVDEVRACESFLWIDNNVYTESNFSATHTLSGAAINGCDSIVTLHLTIVSINNNVLREDFWLTSQEVDAEYQWLKDGAEISNATSSSYLVVENGVYAVRIIKNDCVKYSDDIIITTVGFDNPAISELVVYPSPADGYLYVSGGDDHALISIYHIAGNKVYEGLYSGGRVNVGFLMPGLYIVEIGHSKAKFLKK